MRLRYISIIFIALFASGVMLSAVIADAGPGRHKGQAFKRHHQPRGHIVKVLPSSRRIVRFGGVRYFYSGGLFYRPARTGFIVVTAPIGVIITTLPVGYTTIMIGGAPYFLYNSIYYTRVPTGFIVVDTPPGVIGR